jgi:hypothetical protein
MINPIGFAFENYDAVGRYRSEESGAPVNAAGTYVFLDGDKISFDNALELSAKLAESPEVHSCYVQNIFEYLTGRDVAEEDEPFIEALATKSLEEGISIREIVLRIVGSKTFRYRTQQDLEVSQ